MTVSSVDTVPRHARLGNTVALAAAAIDAASIAAARRWTAPTDNPTAKTRPPQRRSADRRPT